MPTGANDYTVTDRVLHDPGLTFVEYYRRRLAGHTPGCLCDGNPPCRDLRAILQRWLTGETKTPPIAGPAAVTELLGHLHEEIAKEEK